MNVFRQLSNRPKKLIASVVIISALPWHSGRISQAATTAFGVRVEIVGRTMRWKIPLYHVQSPYKEKYLWKLITDFHSQYYKLKSSLEKDPNMGKPFLKLPEISYESMQPIIESVFLENEPKHFSAALEERGSHELKSRPGPDKQVVDSGLYPFSFTNPFNWKPSAYVVYTRINAPFLSKAKIGGNLVLLFVFKPFLVCEFDLDQKDLPTNYNWNQVKNLPKEQVHWEGEYALLTAVEGAVQAKPSAAKAFPNAGPNSSWAMGGGWVFGPLEHPNDLSGWSIGVGADGDLPGVFDRILQKMVKSVFNIEENSGGYITFYSKVKNGLPIILVTMGGAIIQSRGWEFSAFLNFLFPAENLLKNLNYSKKRISELEQKIHNLENMPSKM